MFTIPIRTSLPPTRSFNQPIIHPSIQSHYRFNTCGNTPPHIESYRNTW